MSSTRVLTRRRLGWLAAIAISACLMALVLRQAPLDAIVKSLASADLGLVAAGLATELVIPLLSAARTQRVMSAFGLRVSWSQVIGILLATNFYSLFLPATQASGGVISLYRYRAIGAHLPRAALALGVSRVAEAAAFVGIAGAILLARVAPAWTAIVAGLAAAAVILTLARRRAAPELRLPVGAGVLALAALQVCVFALASGYLARAVGIDLSYANTLWITAGVYLTALLPISVAGLGVREGTLVALAGPHGVSAEQAVAWGLLLLAGRTAIALVGGAVELARLAAGRSAPAGPGSAP